MPRVKYQVPRRDWAASRFCWISAACILLFNGVHYESMEANIVNEKYPVKLSEGERAYLSNLIASEAGPKRKIRRARIILHSDSGPGGLNWSYQRISQEFEVSYVTINEVRRTFVLHGMEAALNRKKPDREYVRRLDPKAEAKLIALARSKAPEGHQRWTLRLLQKRIVQLGYVDSISHETIRATLKRYRDL